MNTTPRRRTALSAAVGVATTTALALIGIAGCAALADTPDDTVSAASNSDHALHEHGDIASPTAKIQLHTTMSHLWAEHMEWTYATVIAFVEDSPALDATLARLLQNQQDIGNAMAGFYGADAADQLTALLTEHIEDAVPVLTAAKAGDTAALDTAVENWYANAEIGTFLAAANPNWNEDDMVEMMRMHITQAVAYASDGLAGDYAKAIADYGIAEKHMQYMGDELAAGLILQFPDMFR